MKLHLNERALVFNLLLLLLICVYFIFIRALKESKFSKENEKRKQISKIIITLGDIPYFYFLFKIVNLTESKIAFPLALLFFFIKLGGVGMYQLYKLYKIDKNAAFFLGILLFYFVTAFTIIAFDYKQLFDLFIINNFE